MIKRGKIIIENPRVITADGNIIYTNNLMLIQVKRIIEKEMLKRNITVDIKDG